MQHNVVNTDNRKILIVDDDQVSVALLSKRLVKNGIEVDYVNSGEKAIKLFSIEKYKMILLDWKMPDQDGIEVLKHFRRKYSSIELPIIMITSKDEANNITEAFDAGGNDYIVKPINMQVALARINTHLQLMVFVGEHVSEEKRGALNTMIITYNHELNNPLMVAFGNLQLFKKTEDPKYLDKLETSLDRMTDIVRKIERFTKENPETETYAEDSKIYKV